MLTCVLKAWRKVLKDLITYYREIQAQYDHRAKSLLKISNVINNTSTPGVFMKTGGLDDALEVLRSYHRDAVAASNKSRDIENDVILALTGLRSDLSQKIKEIKSLSGDFKNSVEKEMDGTRRTVQVLGDALGSSDHDSSQQTGKQDPYLLRLAADRQVERQIDEENYLHQAYLNLETSGRELEAIVVGEIQKSYNAYAGILKREGEEALKVVDVLRSGPIAMPKDAEWNHFVENDEHFVDPRLPVRSAESIYYPGRDSELAAEVRAGLLERKSKYLKSYTAGWYVLLFLFPCPTNLNRYVLSPTHLHEFKSADKSQAPIMSLYLPEQKLGSHSSESGSSNKFMLKGRQTGSMHRGHAWVFRAESHDTMMAWYEDIKNLTEASPQERNAFVRQHARSISGNSQRAGSISSDGAMDEEDEEPFSAANSSVVTNTNPDGLKPTRPIGGRFPSDLQVNTQRGLQAPLSPSSGSSGFGDQQDHDTVAAAAVLPGSGIGEHYGATESSPSHAAQLNNYAQEDGVNPYTNEPIPVQKRDTFGAVPLAAAGVGGAALGAAGAKAYNDRQAENAPEIVESNDPSTDYSHTSQEAATISSPDYTGAQSGAALAAQESSMIAAPDLVTGPESDSGPYLSGGRSQGDLPNSSAVAPPPMFSFDVSAIPAAALVPSVNQPTYSPPEAEATPLAKSQDPLSDAYPAKAGLGEAQTENVPNPLDTVLRPLTERPTLAETIRAGQHHESTMTISNLHIPGEFPRNSVASVSGASAASKDLPV